MGTRKHKTAMDPTTPGIEIEIDGKTYKLHFTFGALITAERQLAEVGHAVNMLQAMDIRYLGAERLPILLFAALLHAQPDITFAEVEGLVTIQTFPRVHAAVIEAYLAHSKRAAKADDGARSDPPEANPE